MDLLVAAFIGIVFGVLGGLVGSLFSAALMSWFIGDIDP